MLFFGGDSIDAADAHEDVVRLQTPQAQAAACFCRFRGSVSREENEKEKEKAESSESPPSSPSSSIPQVVVVVPSRHEAGWACFDHFLNGLTRSGEPAPPLCYSALPGLPALSQAATLLRDGGWPFLALSSSSSSSRSNHELFSDDGSTMDVEELKRRRREMFPGGGAGGGGEGIDRSTSPSPSSSSSSSPWPPTKVVAFSKGGVVANQVLFELSALGHAGLRRRRRNRNKRNREGDGEAEEKERWERNVAAVRKLLLLSAASTPGAAAAAAARRPSPSSFDPSLLPLNNTGAPHAMRGPNQQPPNPASFSSSPPPASSLAALAELVAALAASVDAVCLVDAGLNCRGAYAVTDPETARGIALLDDDEAESDEGEGETEEEEERRRKKGRGRLAVELVGTPRQWSDGDDRGRCSSSSRPFLKQERYRMFSCLKEAGVRVELRPVLEKRKADLRTHFLSIEAFAEMGG